MGVSGAQFDRDQARILSWGDDRTVRLWDASSGQALGAAMRHEVSLSGVSGAQFDRDQTRILSWGGDGTMRLWDASSGQPVGAVMRHEESMPGVWGAQFDRDQTRILSWGGDGTVRLWDVSALMAGNALDVACRRLPDRDLSGLKVRTGIDIVGDLCGPDMPGPETAAPD